MFESRMGETYLAKLPDALHGVDFPATRDEIVEMARMNGAEAVLADRLADLPEGSYDSVTGILDALGAR